MSGSHGGALLSLIEEVPNGQIIIGTPEADALGFMEELFYGNLWKDKDNLYIIFIRSHFKGRGNVSAFIDNLLACGFKVHLVEPNTILEQYAIRHGWKPAIKELPFIYGKRTVWCNWW